MNRYIDADKLINEIGGNTGDFHYDMALHDVWIMIDEQPTADVVEVVRCKDCKYSSPNKVYGCRFEPFNTLENGERMYSDDFCSYGERADI